MSARSTLSAVSALPAASAAPAAPNAAVISEKALHAARRYYAALQQLDRKLEAQQVQRDGLQQAIMAVLSRDTGLDLAGTQSYEVNLERGIITEAPRDAAGSDATE